MFTAAAVTLGPAAFPAWLTLLAWLSLLLGIGCAVSVTVDVARRPQKMGVMNVVWPATMLFGSVAWLLFYRRTGRAAVKGQPEPSTEHPMPISVATGTSHCGAGCAVGDLVGEFSLIVIPGLGAILGLGSWYQDEIFAGWIIDFVLAFGIGIVFQYFAIAPMRGLNFRQGLLAALKADTLSITSWQVGMYGFMALAQFLILPALFGGRAAVLSPEFWLVMQIAMITGFATAYPVNWALIRVGIKEKM